MNTDWRTPEYWRQARPEPAAWAPLPPPAVTSRDPRPADAPRVPRAVAGLEKLCAAHGWRSVVAYSRAQERAVRVGTYKVTEAFGVHAGNEAGWRFTAIYTRTVPSGDWAWRTIGIWMPGRHRVAPGLGHRFVDATITDLLEFVRVHGSVVPAWFKAIHVRELDKVSRQREANRTRPARRKEGAS